jgi:hypothetical protein
MKPYEDTNRTPTQSGVYATEVSASRKLGDVSVTHVAQVSCPDSCPFVHAGCYAENGFLGGFITKRLNRGRDVDVDRMEIARLEARALDRLSGERDLRLHVVGDSATRRGTRILAAAAGRYIARAGRRVWTYTHAWRHVPRDAWGSVSVLASCETEEEVLLARSRGYATAMVVEEHPGDQRHMEGRVNLLPCPAQTRGVTCANCRLCTDDAFLRSSSLTIAFAVHGSRPSRNKALRALRSAVSPERARPSA